LKPADAQTVVGLAAILQAIRSSALGGVPLTDWGIIASPRLMARIEGADTLYKYEVGGAWKVNPLLLPNLCLHAVSGTISQLLQVKGPNFGVGGGTNFITDAFLTACTLLDEQQLPGLWLVVTQCDPDPMPDREGKNPGPWVCHGLALAFQEVDDNWHGLRLHFQRCDAAEPSPWREQDSRLQYADLVQFLSTGMESKQFGAWQCNLDWGARLVLSDEDPSRTATVPLDACSAI
jgi:hypothetical protein